jgi:hypothetical protein
VDDDWMTDEHKAAALEGFLSNPAEQGRRALATTGEGMRKLLDQLADVERQMGTHHVNGVGWNEAPLPSRFHRCWGQTTGWQGLTRVERCACGAIRLDGRGWSERNARRRRARRG